MQGAAASSIRLRPATIRLTFSRAAMVLSLENTSAGRNLGQPKRLSRFEVYPATRQPDVLQVLVANVSQGGNAGTASEDPPQSCTEIGRQLHHRLVHGNLRHAHSGYALSSEAM